MYECMEGLDTIFDNGSFPAHRRGTYFFLLYLIITNSLAESSLIVSFLFLKC